MMARMQLCALAAVILLAVSGVTASGGRRLHSAAVAAAPSGSVAGAPGPSAGAGKPPANLQFTLTAREAVLSAEKLVLTGVAPVALHTTVGQDVGTTPIGEFANSSAGALYVSSAGQWLADPVAVLVGTGNNGTTKALVKLSSPELSNVTTVTFRATILPGDSEASVPIAGGVTARLVNDTANGLAGNLLTAASSTPLSDAALFIDTNSQALGPQAETKFFGCWFGGPWGWGGGPWGGPWGYDHGYDRGYDGYGGPWGGGYWGK